MGKIRDLIKDVSGANMPTCQAEPKKPGMKCGKPQKPGYGHCGRVDCATWYAVVGHGYV